MPVADTTCRDAGRYWPVSYTHLDVYKRQVYGGHSFEGVWPEDHLEPKRYFVFYPDDDLRRHVTGLFDELSFRVIQIEGERGNSHFQELILRQKEPA